MEYVTVDAKQLANTIVDNQKMHQTPSQSSFTPQLEQISAKFNENIMDFTFNINIKNEDLNDDEKEFKGEYCIIISNEKIEYFLDKIAKAKCDVDIFKDSYLTIKNKNGTKITDKNKAEKLKNKIIDKINEIRQVLHFELKHELDCACKIIKGDDFPRHPLNKNQTDTLVNIAKNKYKDVIDSELVTITPVQIFVKNVADISSSNRLQHIDSFISAFENKIRPTIKNHKDCLNFFMVTECEENDIKQKHTFMILNINDTNFIIDSAGHEKYKSDNIKEQVPSIIMFNKYMDDHRDSKLYYTNTRIQVDHVNCYTMSYMTMCDLIEKLIVEKKAGKDVKTSIDGIKKYLASFFANKVDNNVYNEGSLQDLKNSGVKKLLLPSEFLVNSQSDSIYKKITGQASEEDLKYMFADNTTMNSRRNKYIFKGCIRGDNGDVIEKMQVKIVDNMRNKMLYKIDEDKAIIFFKKRIFRKLSAKSRFLSQKHVNDYECLYNK